MRIVSIGNLNTHPHKKNGDHDKDKMTSLAYTHKVWDLERGAKESSGVLSNTSSEVNRRRIFTSSGGIMDRDADECAVSQFKKNDSIRKSYPYTAVDLHMSKKVLTRPRCKANHIEKNKGGAKIG